MGKAEISITSHSDDEIEAMVSEYAFGQEPRTGKVVSSFSKLFGGYSASNYKVEAEDGSVAVLKIMNGYHKSWVDGQTQLQERLRVAGFNGVCHCLPLRGSEKKEKKEFVTMTGGTPSCLLTFCEGVNGATMIEQGKADAVTLLKTVGKALAGLHSVDIQDSECGEAPLLRTWRQGGACLVREHVSGEVLTKMQGSEHTKLHDFATTFYPPRAEDLRRLMLQAHDLPRGCLHGDPFLDNVLVLENGEFSAFVDLEDVSTGPLLFDVACCMIGSCFEETNNTLDLARLEALLDGYTSVRPLQPSEKERMVSYMRLALLCNCSWRFVNFNIDNRSDELLAQREAYIELQQRILQLESPEWIAKVEALVK